MFPELAKIANVRLIYSKNFVGAVLMDLSKKKTKGKKFNAIDLSQFYHLSQKFIKNIFKSL